MDRSNPGEEHDPALLPSAWNRPYNCMVVLHIGKYFPPTRGGMEQFLDALTRQLVRSGTGCVVLAHRLSPRAILHATPRACDDRDGRDLYLVPSLASIVHVPVSPFFPWWLRGVCRRHRPRLLHLHLPNASALWVLALPCARKLPWVVHWHADVAPSPGRHALRLAYRLYRPLEQRLLRRARRIIVTSAAYLRGSEPLSRWRDKCQVVPLGIDTDIAEDGHDNVTPAWAGAPWKILTVCRLTFYKSLHNLLAAMVELPGTRLVIAGDGPEAPRLKRLANRLGVDDRVYFFGACTESQKQALLASCDCFCLPSSERTEAFGVSLLEAMAHARPAVVCNIPGSGVGWVVEHGRTGLCVDIDSPRALADALASLRDDPQRALRMGLAGRGRLLERFAIGACVDATRRLYREVLDATAAVPS